MDKRIVRTRRAILVSVLEQTKDKDLNEVRVVKVCNDAGINKSTFYLHYKSIDDCVKAILENLVLSVAILRQRLIANRLISIQARL